MPGLKVAPQLTLSAEFVTQPNAILAMRGAGKSNAAVRMAEQMQKNGLPFVVIDPKGDWWGIRSSKDGTGPGLPIPVFGGLHGDVPLDAGAGALMAETVVELNLTCVLDVSEFASKNDQIRFLTDFAERLFRLHGKHPHPRHLFLEEADEFIPQKFSGGGPIARCVGAWTKIVKQGRSRGLGITIITQRSAVVNKDALTQVETLFALRTTSPQDRKAIEGWVEYHSVSKELVDSLPTLQAGEAWVISPYWLKRFDRITFYQRETFDSGATPEHGKLRQPANLADIDLDKLRTKMEAAIEKAENEDPSRLQAKVKELVGLRDRLQRELEQAKAHQPSAPPPEPIPVPVPWVPPVVAESLEQVIEALAEIRTAVDGVEKRVEAAEAALEDGTIVPDPPLTLPAGYQPPPTAKAKVVQPTARITPTAARITAPAVPQGARAAVAGMKKADWAFLTVLAQFPDGRTNRQLAMLSGYSTQTSTLSVSLGKLRKFGFVAPGDGSGLVKITTAGVQALGPFETLPSGPALLEFWMGKLKKAERAILQAFVDAYPDKISGPSELCDLTGYSPETSTISVGLGKLRRLELLDGWKAADELMEAIRAR